MEQGKHEKELYKNGKTPSAEMLEEAKKKDKEESGVNIQTKVSIELKLSRNYNTVTFGIQDEPIGSGTEEEFRAALKKKAAMLRKIAEEELKLINTLPK